MASETKNKLADKIRWELKQLKVYDSTQDMTDIDYMHSKSIGLIGHSIVKHFPLSRLWANFKDVVTFITFNYRTQHNKHTKANHNTQATIRNPNHHHRRQ